MKLLALSPSREKRQMTQMTATYLVESAADNSLPGASNYPTALSPADYDELQQAVGVINALWFVEEFFDSLLQNAIELETTVAALVAAQRANIASFPDEVDVEVRLLNRRLMNFLASARAFVDGVQSRLGGVEALRDKSSDVNVFFSEQFDAEFSYRLMDALRNHTQHRAPAIDQTLTMIRIWDSGAKRKQELSVSPQIDRDALIKNGKLNVKTRTEVANSCERKIDLMPHVNTYVQSLGKVVENVRMLYQPEYDAAVETHTALLKDHLDDEWASVWVTPTDDPERRETLITGAYELRRVRRIRLRNVAQP
jgi:hypothetical protein